MKLANLSPDAFRSLVGRKVTLRQKRYSTSVTGIVEEVEDQEVRISGVWFYVGTDPEVTEVTLEGT